MTPHSSDATDDQLLSEAPVPGSLKEQDHITLMVRPDHQLYLHNGQPSSARCYEVLGLTSPCAHCPAAVVVESKQPATIETFLDRTIRQQTLTPIVVDGHTTILSEIITPIRIPLVHHAGSFYTNTLATFVQSSATQRPLAVLLITTLIRETNVFAALRERVPVLLRKDCVIGDLGNHRLVAIWPELTAEQLEPIAHRIRASLAMNRHLVVTTGHYVPLQAKDFIGEFEAFIGALDERKKRIRPRPILPAFHDPSANLERDLALLSQAGPLFGQEAELITLLHQAHLPNEAHLLADLLKRLTPVAHENPFYPLHLVTKLLMTIELLIKEAGRLLSHARHRQYHLAAGSQTFRKYIADGGIHPDTAQACIRMAVEGLHLTSITLNELASMHPDHPTLHGLQLVAPVSRRDERRDQADRRQQAHTIKKDRRQQGRRHKQRRSSIPPSPFA